MQNNKMPIKDKGYRLVKKAPIHWLLFAVFVFAFLVILSTGCTKTEGTNSSTHKAESYPTTNDLQKNANRVLAMWSDSDYDLDPEKFNESDISNTIAYLNETGRADDAIRLMVKVENLADKYLAGSAKKSAPKAGSILDLLHDLGNGYWKMKNYPEAIRVLEKAISNADPLAYPEKASRHREVLARIYIDQGKLDIAEKLLFEAQEPLNEKSEHQSAYWGCLFEAMGQVYLRTGEYSKACQAMNRASLKEPENEMTQLSAAMLCYKSGDPELSKAALQRAVEVRKSRQFKDSMYEELEGLIKLSEGKSKEAENVFRRIIKNQGAGVGSLAGLGLIEYEGGNFEVAEKHFQDSLKLNNLDMSQDYELDFLKLLKVTCYLGLGWSQSAKNENSKAIEYFDQVLLIENNNFKALLAKGNALGQTGRFDEAENTISRALNIHPKSAAAQAEMALIYLNQGKLTQAESMFKRAAENAEAGFSCPYEGLGMVYVRQGKTSLAKQNLAKAIDMAPDREYKKYNELAKLMIKEGELAKAKKLLEQSVQNNPHDPEAGEILKSMSDQTN